MLDNLHRANNIEPLRLLHKYLSRRMPEGECREARISRGMARRDTHVLRRCVDSERVGAETRKALLIYDAPSSSAAIKTMPPPSLFFLDAHLG